MSYKTFCTKVRDLIERAGSGATVRFSRDVEHGRHFARVSDGTTIIGNEDCLKVTVRWGGKNHQAMVAL